MMLRLLAYTIYVARHVTYDVQVESLQSQTADLHRQLQAMRRWRREEGTMKEQVKSATAQLEEAEKAHRIHMVETSSRRQRRRLSGGQADGSRGLELQRQCEEASTHLKNVLSTAAMLAKDALLPELFGDADIGGALLDLADQFQDNAEIVMLVLENNALRSKLDNKPEVEYEPEVLRLWVSREFDDYRDASMISQANNTNHTVFKVATSDGAQAVLKRYSGNTERKSFLREVRTLARLRNHPGIVNVDAWFEVATGGDLYLQMPYYPETMQTVVAGREGETPAQLLMRRLRLFRQVLQTLAWLHQAEVTHRDIKPSNILVDYSGRPVLADFEIARDDSYQGTTTVAAAPRGTYPYMAPEVRQGERAAAPADVWAVGIMLADAFFVTGQSWEQQGVECVVYTDTDRAQLIATPADQGPSSVPDGLVEATRQMLAVSPDDRPSVYDVLQRPNTFQQENAAASSVEEGAIALRKQLEAAIRGTRPARARRVVIPPVTRQRILDRLAPIVNGMTPAKVRQCWQASFIGEDGLDYGGVHIDLLTEACKDFEQRCVDTLHGDGTWRFKPDCDPALARCMGRLIAHALYQDPPVPLPLHLCSAVYAAALGSQSMWSLDEHELQWWMGPTRGWAGWGEGQSQSHQRWLHELDPSGEQLRQWKMAMEAGMDFEGLCRSGDSTAITTVNLQWFVLFKIHQQLFGEGRAEAIRAFGEGLTTLDNTVFRALKAMPGHEVTMKVEGQHHITGAMLWGVIEIRNAIAQEAQWVERTIAGLSSAEVLLLLRFATGHVRLQLDGMLRRNNGGNQRIVVNFGTHGTGGLPRGHTCSYELDIPHYSTEEDLRRSLLTAITSDMAMGMG